MHVNHPISPFEKKTCCNLINLYEITYISLFFQNTLQLMTFTFMRAHTFTFMNIHAHNSTPTYLQETKPVDLEIDKVTTNASMQPHSYMYLQGVEPSDLEIDNITIDVSLSTGKSPIIERLTQIKSCNKLKKIPCRGFELGWTSCTRNIIS